ncbi:MAG: zinc-dependent peptidase [Desulfobulbaceae bacterium]|nr:MAG: zinc-dependent peptidase [Desulfobulbaceae bacterium]
MGIWRWWQRRRRIALIRRAALPEDLWAEALAHASELFAGLNDREKRKLRDLTTLFLATKKFFGARGLALTAAMKTVIAAQACLPILNLDFDCYADWISIVVYQDSFIAHREETDADGIVHHGSEVLAGESWAGGPVVLSWADCAPGAHPHGPAGNVIIHEFAHKLDMLNGVANGMPPLHQDMSVAVWAATMTKAFTELRTTLESRTGPPAKPLIDEYAAEDPAEFFAVLSEYFFMAPVYLRGIMPAVYQQLTLYYRQDPARFRADASLKPGFGSCSLSGPLWTDNRGFPGRAGCGPDGCKPRGGAGG